MDGTQTTLPLTVHLLARSGNSLALQKTIDWLLYQLCPDVRLFLVSEGAAPSMQYECLKKRFEFPGISVTLFLHEELGEERVSQLHGIFQQPPWSLLHTELKQKKHCHISQTVDGFYSLDSHMPVWGIRHVHYGTEIVRITLYCSFDNYEDAVRLYEMILQMEAAAQKAGFCFFVLYATKHMSIQLSLKQLPPGMSVEVKDACALQFIIQAIGQLVPLLPYPCVPISDTRWQTQDYDGNKILLLVNGNTSRMKSPSDGKSIQDSLASPGSSQACSTRRLLKPIETQNQIVLDPLTFRQDFSMSYNGSDQCGNFCGSKCCPQRFVSRHGLQIKETETNVDTGCTAVNHQGQQEFVSRSTTSKVPYSEGTNYFSAGCDVATDISFEQEDSSFFADVKRNKGFGSGTKMFHLDSSQAHHSNSKALEEEFFI